MNILTLTKDSVSIQSTEYGMRAYVNSTRGRTQLEAECSADIVQEVEAVWGSTPTITEPTYPSQPAQTPDQDVVNAEMMMRLAKLEKAVTT
jgi:hypothetical protein